MESKCRIDVDFSFYTEDDARLFDSKLRARMDDDGSASVSTDNERLKIFNHARRIMDASAMRVANTVSIGGYVSARLDPIDMRVWSAFADAGLKDVFCRWIRTHDSTMGTYLWDEGTRTLTERRLEPAYWPDLPVAAENTRMAVASSGMDEQLDKALEQHGVEYAYTAADIAAMRETINKATDM